MLSAGTRLRLGADALVEITGLRNPCVQIERFRPGLLAAVLERLPDGGPWRKAGVMGVVLESGAVKAGDKIEIAGRPRRHKPLQPV
jgi:MOSC domain-containing protein YiiM